MVRNTLKKDDHVKPTCNITLKIKKKRTMPMVYSSSSGLQKIKANVNVPYMQIFATK